ncbi:MAG: MBL fold metallo-hydrolase [Clostridiales bacterium]|nr:MBL fold metallo-hydrolase [Clostridiales bacterium]
MKLYHNVYLVCGNVYSSEDNVYAIDAPEGTILVDTGTDDREYEIIKEQMAYWGLKPVTHVILSHAHINHCFNAARFQREGAKIICTAPVADAILNATDRLIDYHRTSFTFHTRSFEKLTADVVIKSPGEYTFAGLPLMLYITHGHSKGCLVISMMEGERQYLFTGDFMQVAPVNAHGVAGWNGDIEYDADAYLKELAYFSTFEPEAVLPGHGQQCMRDAWQIPKNTYVRALRATHKKLNP